MKFPADFIWGTAVSAYQTEGNNSNTDWWLWEHNKKRGQKYPLEPSGLACDSYNRYEEDFELAKQMHNNGIRLSVEWARIEPKEGVFDQKELDHYKKVLKAARDKGLKTYVTLHHFTNPIWFAKKRGWVNLKAPWYFARYAKKCAQELGPLTNVFFTINEPQVLSMICYLLGIWPPNKVNPILSYKCQLILMKAHNEAAKAIKSVGNYTVGIVKHIVWYETFEVRPFFLDRLMAKFLFFLNSDFFIYPILKHVDVIGLNYYFTNQIKNLKPIHPAGMVSNLNWWINPEGLKKVLLHMKRYKVPIYITENGLADTEDKLRKVFIKAMLIACYESMQMGVQLEGYFYWSLIDNFEWHEGYWPKFGLVAIDRKTLARKPRKSFYYYGEICHNNSLGE
ncbi:MAG: family 1 glycosylhydrolase [Patescibacteria group bacterium]|nr:family 1 glycosylhydrolase [Patescibacteria group bacterium]MBU1952886.1 family 1 glycosylhydrolase [Patescibacteria group bacterium]